MSDTEQTRPHDGDAAFIQALAELLNRNELTELTVKREYGENDKLTVELSKHGKQVIVQAAATPAAPAYAPAPAAPVALAPYGEPEMYYSPPIDRMSRIEIIKGSGSILFGPQTIGGVVRWVVAERWPAGRRGAVRGW